MRNFPGLGAGYKFVLVIDKGLASGKRQGLLSCPQNTGRATLTRSADTGPLSGTFQISALWNSRLDLEGNECLPCQSFRLSYSLYWLWTGSEQLLMCLCSILISPLVICPNLLHLHPSPFQVVCLLITDLSGFFINSALKALIRYVVWKYFFLVCGFSFDFHGSIFQRPEISIFIVSFINFAFYSSYLRNLYLSQSHKDYLLCFLIEVLQLWF